MPNAKTNDRKCELHLTPSEAATYIGCSPSKLSKSRLSDATWVGPPYLKLGGQVLYRKSDLDRWLDDHLVTPTGGVSK